jgi:hypothetical protein
MRLSPSISRLAIGSRGSWPRVGLRSIGIAFMNSIAHIDMNQLLPK